MTASDDSSISLPEDFCSVLAEINHVIVLLRTVISIAVLEYKRDIIFKVFWCDIYADGKKKVRRDCITKHVAH
jgi:hypothetical protein